MNKKLLPIPELSISDTYHAPTNEIEERLVSIWSEVLNLEASQISITSNFFELGGHSLRALLVVEKIREEFDKVLPLQLFFRISTIVELSKFLSTFDVLDSELQDSQEEFSF